MSRSNARDEQRVRSRKRLPRKGNATRLRARSKTQQPKGKSAGVPRAYVRQKMYNVYHVRRRRTCTQQVAKEQKDVRRRIGGGTGTKDAHVQKAFTIDRTIQKDLLGGKDDSFFHVISIKYRNLAQCYRRKRAFKDLDAY